MDFVVLVDFGGGAVPIDIVVLVDFGGGAVPIENVDVGV